MWGFLMSITGPIVTRVLTTLGIGIVTYTGASALLSYVHTTMQSAFNGFSGDAVALLFLSGTPQAMSIILSAISIRLSFQAMSRIQRLT